MSVLIFYRDSVDDVSIGIIVSVALNVSILVMLCIGFTFTYMMEKFPNFAHTSFASLGTICTYYLVRFFGFSLRQTIFRHALADMLFFVLS